VSNDFHRWFFLSRFGLAVAVLAGHSLAV
jgi:hypothetical protein